MVDYVDIRDHNPMRERGIYPWNRGKPKPVGLVFPAIPTSHSFLFLLSCTVKVRRSAVIVGSD